mmetsp:Transcript_15170/g.33477  ORF Transcript_15170/g.33477 Transcript_15170/m.33477 type:complete len:225 (-) Transcript_15170:12-686(-)
MDQGALFPGRPQGHPAAAEPQHVRVYLRHAGEIHGLLQGPHPADQRQQDNIRRAALGRVCGSEAAARSVRVLAQQARQGQQAPVPQVLATDPLRGQQPAPSLQSPRQGEVPPAQAAEAQRYRRLQEDAEAAKGVHGGEGAGEPHPGERAAARGRVPHPARSVRPADARRPPRRHRHRHRGHRGQCEEWHRRRRRRRRCGCRSRRRRRCRRTRPIAPGCAGAEQQ